MTPQTPRHPTHSWPQGSAPVADRACIAFVDDRRLAEGKPLEVALTLKEIVEQKTPERLLVFDRETSRPVELDLRGSVEELERRYGLDPDDQATTKPTPDPPSKGRGRPKLGVVGREVTLLPRHWEWLASQPGGASVTLRKLVEQARRASVDADRQRKAQDATYRFMVAIAGDRPGFEEAIRALFAGDPQRFAEQTDAWPPEVAEHARWLAGPAFEATSDSEAMPDGSEPETTDPVESP